MGEQNNPKNKLSWSQKGLLFVCGLKLELNFIMLLITFTTLSHETQRINAYNE